MTILFHHLSNMRLFRNVCHHDLVQFTEECEIKKISADQLVFLQGAPADHAFFLVTGQLDVLICTDHSTRQLAQIYPGEIFGEQGLLFENGLRNAHVIASKHSHCLKITKDFMRKNKNSSVVTALEQQLIATLTRRIRRANLAVQKIWKENRKESQALLERSFYSSNQKPMFSSQRHMGVSR